MSLQLNPDFSHADVVITTTAPSGSLFTATDAAEKPGFCFADYERSVAPMMWRINFQILGMQMGDYKRATSQEEKQLCKNRIWESLCRLNQKAQMFNPASLPSDIPAPTEEYLALSVTENWCLRLTQELTSLFMNVCHADISRTEISHNTNSAGAVGGGVCDVSIINTGVIALG